MQDYQYKEYGYVKGVAGCIAIVVGLKSCFLGQLIRFGFGTEGIIMGCNLQEVMVLIVKEKEPIKPGARVTATLEPFNMPVGECMRGRVVNPLGEAMDGLDPIKPEDFIPYFNNAPAIMDREGLSRTLETGVKLVDTMLPLGRGQRSLVLGDKMTGKTTILTDMILNQKGKNIICIYCGIAKNRSQISQVINLFKEHEAFEYSTVVYAPASSSPGQQYLAPYAACSVGEFWMYQGKDVFVVFDDFTKHAWAYRELSLLMQVPPGRDSYPGDVFYLHSRMIERAAQLDQKHKGGSMTFIPVVELLEGDLTAYVPTNLVSMTDGQIYLSAPLFNEGFRPAIDVGLSVSRVGSKVQWKAMKDVSKSLRLEFIQYKELLKTSKLQAGGQSEEAREKLRAGKVLQVLLTQPPNKPWDMVTQIIVFYAKEANLLKEFEIEKQAKLFVERVEDYVKEQDPGIYKLIRDKKALDDEIKRRIEKVMTPLVKEVIEKTAQEEE
ncbi:MAG: F0F1 ATP synthase subunit alpha [Candidatus Omnitrophota bacterium]